MDEDREGYDDEKDRNKYDCNGVETLKRKQVPLDSHSHFPLVPNKSFSFSENFSGIDA